MNGRSGVLRVVAGVAGALATMAVATASAQTRPLPPVAQGETTPSAAQVYSVNVKAGDLTSGTLELTRGGAIAFEVFDPGGARIKAFQLYQPGRTRVGFAASVTGAYRIQLTRTDATSTNAAPGVFVLRTDTATPAERLRGVTSPSTVRYLSPRLSRLERELATGQPDALARFWAEARAGGGPIVEPFDGKVNSGPGGAALGNVIKDFVLVTFLWREAYETYNVQVQWPQSGRDDFFMSRLPATDVWYKTVLVRRGSRLSYSLLPNVREIDVDLVSQKDPLNARLAWENFPEYSLLELEGAPDESWFRRTPTARGTISEQQPFKSALLKGQRPIRIYTPPGYSAASGPYPLLVIFDGITYVGGFEAVPTLDNLISTGRIRPVVVCFMTSPGTRPADLGPNASPAFADAMATELVPWLRSSYAISTDPKDIVIGGYSAGGSGAARIALRHSATFGNVLSQSGTFGGLYETSATILAYRDVSRLPIRFYLDVGLYENVNAELPVNELGLSEGLTIGNRHFRDVLMAKGYDVTYRETGGQHNNLHFRATLAEALMALLAPPRK